MDEKQRIRADIVAVAQAAKVSISTVSRSFNHPDLVKPATRKKIDQAVKRLGYIRNRAAQAMHGKRSGTIGLIVPTIDHAIFAEVIQSFSDAIDKAGFTLLIASHGFDLTREYNVLRKFLEHRVDGVALIGLDHSEATYQLIEQQQVPAISIWNYKADSRISCVGAQNYHAGQQAVTHLLGLGHRKIGLVFPRTADNDRARGRLSGALDSLMAQRVSVPENWKVEAPYSIADAKDACLALLGQENRPTAILCGNDVIAQGAVFAATKLGLRVPDDISIMGIGDFKGSQEMEPGLTTIRFPAREIGTRAGQGICALIADTGADVIRECCDIRLSVRGTCRAV
ncbi:MAG: LacI family DNA-binding transcriptional regulator [Planktomarina sp.]